ncbi:MAG: YggS family pyridoxal phosphate-dependent enzyme [Armatimonadota bacterium]|nr:YggS family pyridoxal phosphate-dependent enzyme [Armatimonadota bacterium]MDR7451768.1 YggS family pyridoxal phosphate-dependent enzyme [Armatimonadota bacterium]MDR7467393.1 YggS family pyridoxal phosphate-dependent enzyme [Armatimonadota bacterium]MDR7494163.1 YggS family pyridoxal phosphate-dependent enzyme [Armatimonadota bacterium]MDR7498871.1 YggS family pyridoxal phosphate-dependent enzyme [Armatimonadota bacterium]
MDAEEYRDGTGVGAAVSRVRARIAAAAARSGRRAEEITLVAVTKGVSLERIREVVAAGVADLGESRVQEAAPKVAALGAAVRWHLVGHLQRNKAARAAALFEVIHSVDSAALLAALSRRASRPLDVLLQVKLTEEGGRHGVPPEALAALARQAVGLPGVRVAGLMTIAPPARDPEAARAVFRRLRELRGELGRLIGPLPHLSMGMSDDFEVAVEEGATMVRIGRAIFGPRVVT